DYLAALLLRRCQHEELAADRLSRFLGEFATCGIESIFRVAELALGDRPGALVLLGPEGSAGMDEENLQPGRAPPVNEDARAVRRHRRPRKRPASPAPPRRTACRRCRPRICLRARARASPALRRGHRP